MSAFAADVSRGVALDCMEVIDDVAKGESESNTCGSATMEISDDHASCEYVAEDADGFDESGLGAIPPAVKSQLSRRQFNTTSTVMASNTILNPDLPQIFFTLASVIQAQMIEDEDMRPQDKFKHTEFDILPHIKAEYGGELKTLTEEQLDVDAQNDPVLREKLLNHIVPTVDTIVRFMKLLHGCAKYSTECNIIALIYLNRMSSVHGLSLSMKNWRCVWLTCIILAQKMWDDRPLKTSAFTQLVPPLEKRHLRNFEAKALELLDYAIGVKPALYVKYYFELRQLFISIIGFNESDWQMTPLSTLKARRLDALCDRKLTTKPSSEIDGDAPRGDLRAIITRGTSELPTEVMVVKAGNNTLEDVEYNEKNGKARFVLS